MKNVPKILLRAKISHYLSKTQLSYTLTVCHQSTKNSLFIYLLKRNRINK